MTNKIVDTSRSKTVLFWETTYLWTSKFFNENPEIKIGAEIGIAGGNHIKTLLEKTSIEKIYGIDPIDTIQEGTGVNVESIFGGANNLHNEICEMLQPYGQRSEIIRSYSLDAAHHFQDNSLDFVFIDAIHDYENCFKDIRAWTPKVRKGGFVMGHDWNHPDFPGVTRAVKENFDESIIMSSSAEAYVWYIRKY